MSIIAYPLEATEYTAEDAQSYLSTRTTGVFSDEITLTPSGGMTATISPFLAWFNYAKFKGCSVAVKDYETITFNPAHTVLDRIDRVVLRLDFIANRAYFFTTEALSESGEIELTRSEAAYDISPFSVKIRSGAAEITSADITSTILDENLCGIMRDGVTGIPTAQLQAQAEELIQRLHEAIDGVEEGSAFMMQSVYDPQGKSKPVAFDDEIKEAAFPVGSVVTTRGGIFNKNLPGKWEIIAPLVSIPLKRLVTISSANTPHKEIFDVSEYGILRSSYNIVALPKSATPDDVSISFGEITTGTFGDLEYVKTIEVYVERKTVVNTWVHLLFSGKHYLGADYNFDTNEGGALIFHWERVE